MKHALYSSVFLEGFTSHHYLKEILHIKKSTRLITGLSGLIKFPKFVQKNLHEPTCIVGLLVLKKRKIHTKKKKNIILPKYIEIC